MAERGKRIAVSLTSEEHEMIRKLAQEKGISVARLLREACLEMLEDEEDVKEGLRALAEEEGSCTCEEYLRRRNLKGC